MVKGGVGTYTITSGNSPGAAPLVAMFPGTWIPMGDASMNVGPSCGFPGVPTVICGLWLRTV